MEEDIRFRKLFVGNLWYNTSETSLRNYFLRFGAVAAANVVNDRDGRSRCFGFVTFVNPQDAATACQNRFHIIDGRTVNCNLAALPLGDEESSRKRPRMHFGPPAPHPSPFPFVGHPLPYANPYGSPNYPMSMYGVPPVYPYGQPLGSNQPATFNNPMHRPGQMYVAPPVYPYGQSSLWNERVTGNTSVTTLATTSNTSQNGRPMYGPRSMTGLPSVYEIGQSSGSNGPATDNSNTMVHFRSPNNPMYDPGSLQDQHGLPSDFPYEYDQLPARNEPSGTGYFHPVTSQNDADRRRGGPKFKSRQRRNRK